MSSKSLAIFLQNKGDIHRLLAIHAGIAGSTPGRKYNVEVLNRSAIVLTSACWEAYVEDVVLEAFDFIANNASTASAIPEDIRKSVAASISAEKHDLAVWRLADTGWKTVLTTYRDSIKAKWAGKLNTPRQAAVDELFEKMLAVKLISSCWKWKKMSAKLAAQKLSDLITLRGEIAHRAQALRGVRKQTCTMYLAHVEKLVAATDEAVRKHVEAQVLASPWPP